MAVMDDLDLPTMKTLWTAVVLVGTSAGCVDRFEDCRRTATCPAADLERGAGDSGALDAGTSLDGPVVEQDAESLGDKSSMGRGHVDGGGHSLGLGGEPNDSAEAGMASSHALGGGAGASIGSAGDSTDGTDVGDCALCSPPPDAPTSAPSTTDATGADETVDPYPAAGCGDGIIDLADGEVCDDANTLGGDGCSNICLVETGWDCDGNQPSDCDPVCGDFLVRGAEASADGCDDGNRSGGDGCGSNCKVEALHVCVGEPSVCELKCGDGVVQPDEECDDGNYNAGDGCGDCRVEQGYTCTGDPSDCSDLDECALGLDDCGIGATCENIAGGWLCPCSDGFVEDGEECVNVDECAADDGPCDPNATCIDTAGSFECECRLRWGGDGFSCSTTRVATWPIPTSKTQSYSVDSIGGTVVDDVTGLVWEQSVQGTQFAWEEAIQHCRDAMTGGFTDWRIPMRVELASLLDIDSGPPYIDADAFTAMPEGSFWTGSESPHSDVPDAAYQLDFSTPAISYVPKTELHLVRCVRSIAVEVPPERYTGFSEPVATHIPAVRDNYTGIVWQTGAERSNTRWVSYCASLDRTGGKPMWKLPELRQLLSLAHDDSIDDMPPYFNGTNFPHWSDQALSANEYIVVSLVRSSIRLRRPTSTVDTVARCIRDPDVNL